jgi:hypothetical protein
MGELQTQIDDMSDELEEVYDINEDCIMQLAILRDDAERLMADGAAAAKALQDLKDQVDRVTGLRDIISWQLEQQDLEDVECRLDRLPELHAKVQQYAEQVMEARRDLRSATKRKREQEQEERQCKLCCAADWDCTLPCPAGDHTLCSSCLGNMLLGATGEIVKCPWCTTHCHTNRVAYNVS